MTTEENSERGDSWEQQLFDAAKARRAVKLDTGEEVKLVYAPHPGYDPRMARVRDGRDGRGRVRSIDPKSIVEILP